MLSPYRLLLISTLTAANILPSASAASPQISLRDDFVKHYNAIITEPENARPMIHKALTNYSLYPYIEYQLLRTTLDQQPDERINDFLQRNADTPLYGRLLFAWARHSGQQGNWNSFDQAWQKIEHPSTELKCLNGQYRMEQGDLDNAWRTARSLWTVGHSQPDICDPLFDIWLKSDNFSSSDALARYLAALTKGREGLATYVKRFISDRNDSTLAEQALALFKTPRLLLDEPNKLQPGHPNAALLLDMNVRRLARVDLDAAIKLWTRDRTRLNIPTDNWGRLSTHLGVWRAKRFPAGDERTLLAQLDPDYRYSELTGWRIRLALSDRDWTRVTALIAKLPNKEQQSDRWRYWQAIAQRHLDGTDNRQLDSLVQERSFYGFMAAQILGQGYTLNDRPAEFSQQQLDTLAANPAFVRMRELLALERYYDARSEWNMATAKMSPERIHLASHVVQSWGWHHQGIRGAISSQQWNDMQLRFPNPYSDLYQTHARNRNIDPAWALAITRQESAFWMGAKSRAGARGLMQLMPATARATARRHGITLPALSALNKPETNIKLGTAYLSEVAERFNGNQAYATAAYNAGPTRVSRWLDERGKLPLDIWIETIPYDETRNYVQNVLSFRVIYEQLANHPVSLFSEQEFSTLALQQK